MDDELDTMSSRSQKEIVGVTLTGVAPLPISAASTSIAAFVGPLPAGPENTPVVIASHAEFAQTFSPMVDSPLAIAVSLFFANGGTVARVVRIGSGVPDDEVSMPVLEALGHGVWALRDTTFNLLCVPPYTTGRDGDVSARTRRAAAALCREHRAIFVTDPLAAWSSGNDVVTGIRTAEWGLTPDSNVAVYWPWLSVSASAGGTTAVAPSGAVAGVIARVDTARRVWKAPAGRDTAVVGLTGLAASATQADQDAMNRAGINLLRSFDGIGPVVWGARTLAGDDTLASDWKYLPVRRLALFIESSILQSTAWVAFEPNAEPLWRDLRNVVGTFLQGLFSAGAFQGRTARDAWFVKCDAGTMSQDDIDNGRLIMQVGIAPLKPAEFVVLRISTAARRPPP